MRQLRWLRSHRLRGEFQGELSKVPPYSAPHHTASAVALIGGGTHPRPGAVSRAHNGVLFLDEFELARSYKDYDNPWSQERSGSTGLVLA